METDNPPIKYFAYGSNLSHVKLMRTAPSARIVGVGCLSGWALRFDKVGRDGFGRATIAERPAAEVWGVVYDMTYEDKVALDSLEGLGRGYAQKTVTICTVQGEALAAVTYVGVRLREGLSVTPWYADLVLGGAVEHRLPGAYVATVARALSEVIGGP